MGLLSIYAFLYDVSDEYFNIVYCRSFLRTPPLTLLNNMLNNILSLISLHSFYGALLLIQCRSAQASNISWVFMAAMLCDIIETGTFNYATKQFPTHISSTFIRVASIANEIKWLSFGVGMVSLVGLFVYNSRRRDRLHQE